jgi:PAS domain-containing protein
MMTHQPELRVGYHDFAPYTRFDANGGPEGMAVEIVKLAAVRAGVRLVWVPTGPAVDESLRSGQVDMYPMLALTDSRMMEFYTSDAWWENESILVSRDERRLAPGASSEGRRIAIRGLAVLKAIAEVSFPKSELVIIPTVSAITAALCRGEVDGAFLDVRLLQSQLLSGPEVCAGHPLYVASVPNGTLSLGTIARREARDTVKRIYEEIAGLAVDGSVSAAASHWSMVSSFQNRQLKDILEQRQRTTLMRLGMAALTVLLVLALLATARIRRARIAVEETEQRFEAFMTHIPVFASIHDSDGGLVYWNRPSPAPLSASVAQASKERPGEFLETTRTTETASGQHRHFLCLQFPFTSPRGQVLTGSVALDITERRDAEDALRFSQFSIERSPDSVLWLDSGNTVFYANEAACRALGYSLNELKALRPEVIGDALGAEQLSRGLPQGGGHRSRSIVEPPRRD